MKGIKINERIYNISEKDYKYLIDLISKRFTPEGIIKYKEFAKYIIKTYKEIKIYHMINVGLKDIK